MRYTREEKKERRDVLSSPPDFELRSCVFDLCGNDGSTAIVVDSSNIKTRSLRSRCENGEFSRDFNAVGVPSRSTRDLIAIAD